MKILQEHIGKKLKNKKWGINSSGYFIPQYINELYHYAVGKNHKNQIVLYQGVEYKNDDWELVYEIPANQAWVIPGRKYRFKDSLDINYWFIPKKYHFESSCWEGLNNLYLESYAVMSNKNDWEEFKEHVVLAPALYMENNQETVSRTVYASEEEAKQHLRGKKFIKWPVAYFIEVPEENENNL